MTAENWKFQHSLKTPSGDMLNIRGETFEEFIAGLQKARDPRLGVLIAEVSGGLRVTAPVANGGLGATVAPPAPPVPPQPSAPADPWGSPPAGNAAPAHPAATASAPTVHSGYATLTSYDEVDRYGNTLTYNLPGAKVCSAHGTYVRKSGTGKTGKPYIVSDCPENFRVKGGCPQSAAVWG